MKHSFTNQGIASGSFLYISFTYFLSLTWMNTFGTGKWYLTCFLVIPLSPKVILFALAGP
jgi:hypothetical protein